MGNLSYKRSHAISWGQLHSDSKELARRLFGQRFPNGIIAVTRGGLVPAAIVARELNIRLVDTLCLSSYSGQDRSDTVQVLKPIQGQGEGCLVIDDLVDTGGTARVIRELLPKAHFATVYAKPAGRPLVDTVITELSQDTWVLFPWDSEVQFVEPLAADS